MKSRCPIFVVFVFPRSRTKASFSNTIAMFRVVRFLWLDLILYCRCCPFICFPAPVNSPPASVVSLVANKHQPSRILCKIILIVCRTSSGCVVVRASAQMFGRTHPAQPNMYFSKYKMGHCASCVCLYQFSGFSSLYGVLKLIETLFSQIVSGLRPQT